MEDSCWIISDGTMGMELQCVALAKSLNLQYQIKYISPSQILTALPQFGAIPSSGKTNILTKNFVHHFLKFPLHAAGAMPALQ